MPGEKNNGNPFSWVYQARVNNFINIFYHFIENGIYLLTIFLAFILIYFLIINTKILVGYQILFVCLIIFIVIDFLLVGKIYLDKWKDYKITKETDKLPGGEELLRILAVISIVFGILLVFGGIFFGLEALSKFELGGGRLIISLIFLTIIICGFLWFYVSLEFRNKLIYLKECVKEDYDLFTNLPESEKEYFAVTLLIAGGYLVKASNYLKKYSDEQSQKIIFDPFMHIKLAHLLTPSKEIIEKVNTLNDENEKRKLKIEIEKRLKLAIKHANKALRIDEIPNEIEIEEIKRLLEKIKFHKLKKLGSRITNLENYLIEKENNRKKAIEGISEKLNNIKKKEEIYEEDLNEVKDETTESLKTNTFEIERKAKQKLKMIYDEYYEKLNTYTRDILKSGEIILLALEEKNIDFKEVSNDDWSILVLPYCLAIETEYADIIDKYLKTKGQKKLNEIIENINEALENDDIKNNDYYKRPLNNYMNYIINFQKNNRSKAELGNFCHLINNFGSLFNKGFEKKVSSWVIDYDLKNKLYVDSIINEIKPRRVKLFTDNQTIIDISRNNRIIITSIRNNAAHGKSNVGKVEYDFIKKITPLILIKKIQNLQNVKFS